MKKILLCLVMCWTCVGTMMAQSQAGRLSIKPMVGVNLSNFSNAAIDMYRMKVGLTAGAEFEYGVNPWLGLSLGVMYSQQGAKVDGSVDALIVDNSNAQWYTNTKMDGKLNCNNLNLPLMANVYIPSIKGLAFKAGIQVGLLASDKMSADATLVMMRMDNRDYFELHEDGEMTNQLITSKTEVTDVCKSVDFGIPLGVSYEYKNIILDARYYFGLTKIDKTDNPDTARNQYLSITLGYKFNLK